jgi:hypothetical protein
MTFFSLDPLFDFTVYALQEFSIFIPTYELHKGFRKKRQQQNMPWRGSTNTTYKERPESKDPKIPHI